MYNEYCGVRRVLMAGLESKIKEKNKQSKKALTHYTKMKMV